MVFGPDDVAELILGEEQIEVRLVVDDVVALVDLEASVCGKERVVAKDAGRRGMREMAGVLRVLLGQVCASVGSYVLCV